MTSPAYEHLTQRPAQFAASVKSVLGGFDVINVQDSRQRLRAAVRHHQLVHRPAQGAGGASSALWDDADMFSATSHGGPMTPAQQA